MSLMSITMSMLPTVTTVAPLVFKSLQMAPTIIKNVSTFTSTTMPRFTKGLYQRVSGNTTSTLMNTELSQQFSGIPGPLLIQSKDSSIHNNASSEIHSEEVLTSSKIINNPIYRIELINKLRLMTPTERYKYIISITQTGLDNIVLILDILNTFGYIPSTPSSPSSSATIRQYLNKSNTIISSFNKNISKTVQNNMNKLKEISLYSIFPSSLSTSSTTTGFINTSRQYINFLNIFNQNKQVIKRSTSVFSSLLKNQKKPSFSNNKNSSSSSSSRPFSKKSNPFISQGKSTGSSPSPFHSSYKTFPDGPGKEYNWKNDKNNY
ncbi:hypothetical protein WA158_006321 [Blastocystis sp. Blastoise]